MTEAAEKQGSAKKLALVLALIALGFYVGFFFLMYYR
jgi:hypothetical protein